MPRRRSRRGQVLTVGLLAGAGLLAGLVSGPTALGAVVPTAAATAAADVDRYATPVVAAHPANASNPLAGRPWGVYRGPVEQAWAPYERATGWSRSLLAEIALRPKAKWFGSRVPEGEIAGKVRDYVRVSQAGDPRALVQLALFRVRPWGEEVCRRLPSAAEATAYRRWIAGVAQGLGSAHAAVVLQPDLLVARCAPDGGRAVARLVAQAVRTLEAQPHTSVYVDGGAGDWPPPSRGGAVAAVDHLVRAGVADARGFALNATHYSDTRREVARAAEIDAELTRRGITGKRAVISTSSNGKPFEFGFYSPQSSRDNARTCRSATDQRMCVTLGIPPSMDPDAPAWRLGADVARTAARVVDGYLWFGRPWLKDQADPFIRGRAHALVRSWPLRPTVG